MSRCPDASAFSAFVSGVLPAGERTELELHIDACERCRVALSETCRRAMPARSGVALPVTGDRVGRYTIGERLGAGAMGVVYAARDGELDRDVAIKLVQPQAGAPEEELVRQRMLREGRALARIDHPNVVRVYDVGSWSGALFVAMERVAGGSLRAWLAAERRSAAAIVDVFVQCAHGLAAAHAAGVIHRDIKPDNIIVDATGRARVTDFGLALTAADRADDQASAPGATATAVEDPRLTRTDGIVGTPAYMAPEQRGGASLDERADQFSLCVAAVEALTGERPGAGAKLAGLPRRVRGALERGLALAPAQRFPSSTALAAALAPRRARWPLVIAGVVVLSVAAAYVLVRTDGDACTTAANEIAGTWHAGRAPQLAGYARAGLDRYAASWRTARAEACRAAQPVAIRCLERRRRELAALVARWEAGSHEALAAAPEVVDALEPPARCDTADADPAAAGSPALAAFEARFASARADGRVGRAHAAVAALVPLVNELAAFPALRAEALVELAASEADLGRAGPAREHLIAAIAAAETAGAARTRADAWLHLAELASDDAVKLAEARDALRLSGAVLEHLGNPAVLVQRREVARGIVAMRAGEPAEAVAALRTAVAAEAPPTERARRLQVLARALIAAGDAAAALAELERAEQILVAALGRDAPPLVWVYMTMTEPLDYLGRRNEAVVQGERALALVDRTYGPDNPRRVAIVGNLAVLHGNRGEFARALELLAEARRAYERAGDEFRTAQTQLNIAATQLDAGTPPELPALELVIATFTRVLGPEHPTLANAHSVLAQALQLLGRHGEAIEHARRALAIREAAHVGGGYIAFSRFELADMLVAGGRRAEGIAMARHALEIPLASTGREAALAAEIRSWLAQHAR